MSNDKKIKNALISVFHKDGLSSIVKKLHELGIDIYSTGGTQKFIEEEGINVNRVEDLTSYPSILGGRVKTLHPKVFGGILSRRGLQSDKDQLSEYEIPEFDLVIVDLYPFEQTVFSGASEQDIIEKIDIGGISLIRAAAKNFKDVIIVSEMSQYDDLLNLLNKENGNSSIEIRKEFATKAFNISSHYDTSIFNYFNNEEVVFKQSIRENKTLRYGENPHQKGVFFGNINEMFDQLNGKELSYNNLLDVDAAVNLISEFSENTFIVMKHNNACGIASKSKLIDCWKDALAADPVSAFGGVLITNKEVDSETAQEINKLFFEVIIAPSYNEDALSLLKSKKNRVILIQKDVDLPKTQFRTALNGVLFQEKDSKTDSISGMKTVTVLSPSEEELSDLEFASKVCKHTKSNTIVFVKNNQLLASGVGQTSRVDALRQAVVKAKSFNFNLNGAVMASDAFFPFPDCVEFANNEGIKCVIQPGGSIKDNLSIDFCNENNMKMVLTGFRHFKH
ncbi:MAG: bifunctional phosphoribosylaminoimidazolecarboxamide formyltransferase/IMP cyclohydrolase [Flavobacteriales bacterium]|jgi:phosphoribosylaminoimidazolecarboxamide formyltransferase / IMP cyclohydrolase|nr:bifunctional phosphoribosylaminoimidazolecarboxamide formyltransferase/IMP cyclohydrolase [Flavobacteriales bacterium]MBT7481475.1 bifunctional phosphoribosylaminoimidazolecarboxamide formyltransferase/IMP cyclohydrolase [Flavobacteriales bacterium]